MSDNLRSKMIRLAATMPKGSDERKALLDVLTGSALVDTRAITRSARSISSRYGGEIPYEAAYIIADSAHRNQASGAWPQKPLPVDAGEYTDLLEGQGFIMFVRGRYTLTNRGMSAGLN